MVDTRKDAAGGNAKTLVKAAIRFCVGISFCWALIFIPARSLAYWRGWVFIGTLALLVLASGILVFRKDPALLEKRTRTRETEPRQKRIVLVSLFLVIFIFGLPGLDWRLGWSRMPGWLAIPGLAIVIAGYALFIAVMRANSFLSRVVEVQEGQRVIDSGPYALVRHPMYVSTIMIYLAAPLVLGSYWALIPAACYVPLLAARIGNEEEVLARELPGYEAYRGKVKWRLLPGVY